MSESYEMIAKTFQGLEEVLAKELTALGANNIEIGRRMVAFTGDKEMMYKANFYLRTAIRILKPIHHFEAKDADEVYEQIKAIPWEEYLNVERTFAVDAVVFSEVFRHSKFVAYKVKDAIVDYFREKTGQRPGVRVNHPDVLLNIHIAETRCTLSLDSSGESLHRRGYRQEAVEAPLNEVLAAGMILLTGWHGETDLIDPMCGSGTIPIEAALIARNIAPGVFRKGFAFERWADFDQDLFDTIYNDDSQEREFTHKIYAYDNNPKAIEIATNNIKAAGCSRDIALRMQPFQQFTQPTEKAIIITNPPYGERISTYDLLGLYDMIGERLKHTFTGGMAWILSYREECFDQIGLKPTQRIPLFNGPLECEFRQYEIFEGKYNDFRAAGEELSKDRRAVGANLSGNSDQQAGEYANRDRQGYGNQQGYTNWQGYGYRRSYGDGQRGYGRDLEADENRRIGYNQQVEGQDRTDYHPRNRYSDDRQDYRQDYRPRDRRDYGEGGNNYDRQNSGNNRRNYDDRQVDNRTTNRYDDYRPRNRYTDDRPSQQYDDEDRQQRPYSGESRYSDRYNDDKRAYNRYYNSERTGKRYDDRSDNRNGDYPNRWRDRDTDWRDRGADNRHGYPRSGESYPDRKRREASEQDDSWQEYVRKGGHKAAEEED